MGWGPLAWERRPRPEAQTPWHARRSCQDAGDSRPPVAPAQPLQLQGICCSRADAIRRFPVSVLAPRLRPRVQPGGRGSGAWPPPSVRLHRGGPAHPAPHAQTAQRAHRGLSALGGGPCIRGLPLPAGSIAYWPPTQSTAPPSSATPSPHELLTVPVLGQAWPSQLSHPLPPLPAGPVPEGASGLGPVSTLPPAGG